MIEKTYNELYIDFLEAEKDLDIKLDKWQVQVVEHEGNAVLRTGRQVGKSTVIARKASGFCTEYVNTVVLILAASQRQSSLLFNKVLQRLTRFNDFIIEKHGNYIDDHEFSGRQNQLKRKEHNRRWGLFEGIPTKTEIRIKQEINRGLLPADEDWTNFNRDEEYVIYSLPAGKTGAYIRGLTIDLRIVDEAAFVAEEVYVAVNPMLAVSKKKRGLGWDILLSTPYGKGGYFYNSCGDDDYREWHISSELCPRIPRDYLTKERNRMSKVEYAQEYLGEFVDEYNQFFPTKLIKKLMTFTNWDRKTEYNVNAAYYLGIDPARYGQDEAAFVSSELHKKIFKIVHCEEKKKAEGKAITSLRDFSLVLHGFFKYKRIFNDDTGVGGGLTDLLQEALGKSRVVGINNASKRVFDSEGERRKGILKEDLYSNALSMMEKSAELMNQGKEPSMLIINNLKLLRSLKSVQFEYTKDRNLRIHGKYTHLAEAFVRCCWAMQSKGLKLFVA